MHERESGLWVGYGPQACLAQDCLPTPTPQADLGSVLHETGSRMEITQEPQRSAATGQDQVAKETGKASRSQGHCLSKSEGQGSTLGESVCTGVKDRAGPAYPFPSLPLAPRATLLTRRLPQAKGQGRGRTTSHHPSRQAGDSSRRGQRMTVPRG